MKILHLADIHACPKHHKWVSKALDFAVTRAIEERCDIAIIAGDSFEHSLSTNEPAFHDYVHQMIRLATEMPVYVLYGTPSHDKPGSLDVLSDIPTRHPIHVSRKPEVLCEHGITLCFLPSLNHADREIMDIGPKKYLDKTMAWFRQATDADRSTGDVSALITHGTVCGSVTESNHAMVHQDWEFDEDTLFSSGADAIMLGHIHAHQHWERLGRPMAYTGSLARLVHGDYTEKGFLIWDIDPWKVSFELIQTPTRQLFEIEFTGPPSTDELNALAKDAGADDAVRIRYNIDKEHAHSVDKGAIQRLFAHCDSYKLEPTILHVQSVRAPGIAKAATLEGKLEEWGKTVVGGVDMSDITSRLRLLQTMDVDAVVEEASKDHG